MSAAIDLVDEEMWSSGGVGGFGAMRVLPGTGPKHEVIRVLGGVEDPRMYRPVAKELDAAVQELRELDRSDRLGLGYAGGPQAVGAIVALQNLVRALESVSEDTGAELAPVTVYLEDPPRLRDDLRDAIGAFSAASLEDDLDRLRTFSLILFRDEDLGGAVTRSLLEERHLWRSALRPAHVRVEDLHLAVIPPPSASRGITELAAELGCVELLPCVVFLGERIDPTQLPDTIVIRLSARRIEAPPPNVPDQLRQIYRSVYGSHARAPGRLWTAAGDKFVQILAKHVNAMLVLQLLAGAVGGPALVSAVKTVHDVLTPGESG
jgi:hypothetical protein